MDGRMDDGMGVCNDEWMDGWKNGWVEEWMG